MNEGKRKSMKCDSFIFYASFFEAIKKLPESNQLELYNAIFEYGLNGIEPQLEGVNDAIFDLIRPQLKANRTRYENGCKGGAPVGNSNARRQPKNNQDTTEGEREKQPKNNQKQPNNNENVNVNENISLLKTREIKERLIREGAYTRVYDDLIDEVAEALGRACGIDRGLKFDGRVYTAEDFQQIAEDFDRMKLCRVVNSLLAHKDEIENREYYILGVVVKHAEW